MKKWLFIAFAFLAVLTITFISYQPNQADNLCRQFEKQTNQVCKKTIITDWENRLGIIQSNDSIVFMELDDKGKWEIPSTNVLIDGIDQATILWIGSSDQKRFNVFGIASNEVKHMRIASPTTYDLTIIRQGEFSIFYTPLTEPEHMYAVNIQGFDEQGRLIYGKPINE